MKSCCIKRVLLSFAWFLLCVGAVVSVAQTVPIPRLAKPDVMPKLMKSVDPQFSDEARLQKKSGTVLVHALIDATGHVAQAQVLRGVGYGLDEEAIAAVKQYLFLPARTKGVAVACDIAIQINFEIRDQN